MDRCHLGSLRLMAPSVLHERLRLFADFDPFSTALTLRILTEATHVILTWRWTSLRMDATAFSKLCAGRRSDCRRPKVARVSKSDSLDVFRGWEHPDYRPGAKSIPRAETALAVMVAQVGTGGPYLASSSIIYLVPTAGSRAVAPSPSAAFPEPALLLSMAVATPIPVLPDPASPSPAPSPSPAINVAYAPAVVPAAVQAAPAADSQQAIAEMAPNEAPLRRDEAREVQARLRSFGFNPGPVDGDPGAMTEGAIRRYQQNRRQPQTGKVDRELLEQLRHDPAPKIVQRTAGPYARPTPSPEPPRPNPFESVRAAGIASASGWNHGYAKAPARRPGSGISLGRYQQPPFWE